MSFSTPRIIVTGYAGCVPVGGVAWDYLQYAVGLSRLGYDVYYHEDTLKWPYHPQKRTHIEKGDYSARFIENFFRRFAPELSEHWHYFHLREKSFGMSTSRFEEIARSADLFLNISGSVSIPNELSPHCKKIFIDTDPGYNQIKMVQKKETTSRQPGFLRVHDQYFTYAENIHSGDCLVPTLDVRWKTTRMPVVIDLWKDNRGSHDNERSWTTVMTWTEFKERLVYNGVRYEGKASEMEKILSLPQKVSVPMKIAIGGTGAPVERLIENGWSVVSGPAVSKTAENYRRFIQNSRGEISVAKHVYVHLRTGWFSCRSACYLAAGRPVVVQATGFDKKIPVGKGLLTFNDINEAAAAVKEVESNYEFHAKAAHAIAEEYFDSKNVLTQLVQDSLK